MEDWFGKPRVLIAGKREDNERMARVLSGYLRRFAATLEEATQLLERGDWSLIVIGARFEERRQLVHWLQAQGYSSIPVAQVDRRAARRPVSPRDVSPRAGYFLEVQAFPEDHRGDRRLRRALDSLMESREYGERAALPAHPDTRR